MQPDANSKLVNPRDIARAVAPQRWGTRHNKTSPPDEKTVARMQRMIAAAAQGKERFYQQWEKEFPQKPKKPSKDLLAKQLP